MAHDINKLSLLVKSQLPEYIRDNNETFVAFLKAYYEFLEQDGNAHATLIGSTHYKDIDQTIDSFVDYFMKQFVYGIPLNIFEAGETEAKRFLVKYISSMYRAKGSPNALKFLFRLAFDEEIDVIFPNDYLLRPSDGKWNRTAVVRASIGYIGNTISNASIITGKEIFPSLSNVIYTGIDSYIEQDDGTYVLYLDEKEFLDNDYEFIANERLCFSNATINANVVITVLNTLSSIDIVDGGLGYTTDDNITITINPSWTDHNLRIRSQDFENSNWLKLNGATGVANIADPLGGISSYTINANAGYLQGATSPFPSVYTGMVATEVIWLKANAAITGGIVVADNSDGVPAYAYSPSITTFWQKFSFPYIATAASSLYDTIIILSHATAQVSVAFSQCVMGPDVLPYVPTTTTGIYGTAIEAPTAGIGSVNESGKISSIYVINNSSNITGNITVSVPSPSNTRTATYTSNSNVTTIRLNSNIRHGLSVLDSVNLVISSGGVTTNNYIVSDVVNKRVFRVQSVNANTLGNLTLTYLNTANLQANVGTVVRSALGYGLTVDGQLDTTILIQDSNKWQQYSYIIRSSLDITTWADLVKKTLHPAGLALFGEVTIYTEVEGSSTSGIYAGPIGKPVGPYDSSAYDAFILFIYSLFTDTPTEVNMGPPDAYYVIESNLESWMLDPSSSRISAGSTLEVLDQFKFEYGNAFPINIIGDYTINSINHRIPTNFQPPSHVESPYRDLANANVIYSQSINT